MFVYALILSVILYICSEQFQSNLKKILCGITQNKMCTLWLVTCVRSIPSQLDFQNPKDSISVFFPLCHLISLTDVNMGSFIGTRGS